MGNVAADMGYRWLPSFWTDSNGEVSEIGGEYTSPQKRGFVDFGRVQDCATQIFHVDKAALDWRPGEGIMRFDFYDPAQGPGWLTNHGLNPLGDPLAGWFSVNPDLSKSLVQVARDNPFAGRTGGVPYAYTSRTNPSHPYLPNDVNFNSQGFFGLFVHELGNALAYLTKKTNDPNVRPTDEQQKRWGHSDPGVTFEDCVFGRPVSQDSVR